ncbi:hotdog fold thioesterase [Actinomycetospora endophytica]|uniref:Hotdog fold thioesterase n=1 Tax=Actinomycetospora endophytica TaxID=2291215 RepID=A0ABS8PHK5_9PSEU|nr:hotdog domain-containing protein [Actinomycetospora endophytica]MCD2197748.1 hotdog fold thioesterase [Actinomycetospora endophytica]
MIDPGLLVSDPFVTPIGVPEKVFGVGPIEIVGAGARSRMTTAGWMHGEDGRPTPGPLGLLVDDVVGQATLCACPAGRWPVTTELSIDVVAPMPGPGTELEVSSTLAAADPTTGTGRGEVWTAGGLLALGTVWTRNTPATPGPAAVEPDADDALEHARASTTVRALLDASLSHEDGRTTMALPPGPVVANATGNGHGGVLACAAEVTAAAAVHGPEHPLVTSGLRVTFLRPAVLDGGLTFTADVVHRGRALSLVHVTVWRADGRRCATASVIGRAAP